MQPGGHPLLLLLACPLLLLLFCPLILADGLPFDTELYPPSLDMAHNLLSKEQLLHMFGVQEAHMVDHTSYTITALHDVTHEEAARAKRAETEAPDAAFKLNVFGNTYNLKMTKRSGLFAPGAKLVVKEDNKTYTETVTRGNYTVAWLIADANEGASYESDDGEDQTSFGVCDHYIDRSFAEVSAVVSECWNGTEATLCEYGDDNGACEYDWEDYYDPELESSIYGRKRPRHMRDLSGIIFDKNGTYEVYSVPIKIQQLIEAFREDYNKSMGYNVTGAMMHHGHHVFVKKAAFPQGAFGHHLPVHNVHKRDGNLHHEEHHVNKRDLGEEQHEDKRDLGRQRGPKQAGTKYVETGVFMDHAAYSTYRDYFQKAGHSNPDQRVVDLLLTFINSIQALYHFSSLGTKVEFAITHLEIHKTPGQFKDYSGDRGPLLTSFCEYQGGLRPAEGKPGHWDIGLLVSGVDFWAEDSSGKKSHLTMGLATVTGICTKSYGCVIGEMGVRDRNAKPYPSTGFTSVYVMAHEIGHNLGMSHDSSGNSCPSNGYIMSPSRGTKGECVWSSCSRDHMRNLDLKCLENKPGQVAQGADHNKYRHNPGQQWDADSQCQLLMFTSEAKMDHNSNSLEQICHSLKCRAQGLRGYYRAGPALEGTPCGSDKVCNAGKCVKNTISPGATSTAHWSEWSSSGCQSGCIVRSKGYTEKTRTCVKQTPVTISSSCPGQSSSTVVGGCNPSCSLGKTMTAQDYAKQMCQKFVTIEPKLRDKINPYGEQTKHSSDRPELACQVHCQKRSGNQLYSPVAELQERKDVSVYFPDGTFCHQEGTDEYFCRKNTCVSSQRGSRATVSDLGYQMGNHPGGFNVPAELEAYFSVDPETGEPVGDNPNPEGAGEVEEGKYEMDDLLYPK